MGGTKKRVLIAGGGGCCTPGDARTCTSPRTEARTARSRAALLVPTARRAALLRLGEVPPLTALDAIGREIHSTSSAAALSASTPGDTPHVQEHPDRVRPAPDRLRRGPMPAIAGALTSAPGRHLEVGRLLRGSRTATSHPVAFVIPWGAVYSLPAYELALLTSSAPRADGCPDVEITSGRPKDEPLQVFGPPASEAIRRLLSERGVALRTDAYPERSSTVSSADPRGRVEADRFVALPRLMGPPIDGIPQTVHGFIPVDAHCRVHGVEDVYAAGDITSFTVKQGGIATQQADAAAEAIAAAAGADVEPRPFRPVLRGLLLTGRAPATSREIAFEPDPSRSRAPRRSGGRPRRSSDATSRRSSPGRRSSGRRTATGRLPPTSIQSRSSSLEPDRRRPRRSGPPCSSRGGRRPSATHVGRAARRRSGGHARRDRREDARPRHRLGARRRVRASDRHPDVVRPAPALPPERTPSEARVREWMTAEPITVSARRRRDARSPDDRARDPPPARRRGRAPWDRRVDRPLGSRDVPPGHRPRLLWPPAAENPQQRAS